MSIASQIQTYADGLSDAYDMVAQRGGTMPAQKNMANLDTAIATIPSGGGSTPTTPTLTSATLSNGVITLTGTDFGSSPKVLMFNRKYDRYDTITPTTSSSTSATVPVGTSDYGYFSRVVKVENGGYESGVKFVYDDFESLGSTYDVIAWGFGANPDRIPLVPVGSTVYNFTTQAPTSTNVLNQRNYNLNANKIPGGQSTAIATAAIVGIEFNTALTSIDPSNGNFLGYCSNLNQPLGLANVTELSPTSAPSGSFLGGATSFNSPVDLGGVTKIGGGFLYICTSFNQPLDLSNVEYIGNTFLEFAMSFDSPITMPVGTSAKPITLNGRFMCYCSAMSHPITFDHCDIAATNYFLTNAFSLPAINVISSTLPASIDARMLGASGSNAMNCPMVQDGILVNGDSAATTWLSTITNSTSRKLVAGTITS